MGITVKGVEVRSEEVNTTVSVNFEDLTEAGQKRIFLENKEEFVVNALKSQYSSVKESVWMVRRYCSSAVLNKAIEECIKRDVSAICILELLNVPGFQLSEENRKKLACSVYWELRLWVAEDEQTPLNILKNKRMLIDAIRDFESGSSIVLDAIVKNPNFEVDEQIKQTMKPFSDQTIAKVMARIEELKK